MTLEDVFFFLATLAGWALDIYQWIIIVAILLTWVNPDPNNPIVRFLNRMTLPVWNALAAVLPSPLKLFAAYFALLLVWFLKVFVPGCLTALGEFAAGRMSALELPVQFGAYFLLGLGIVLQNFFTFLILLLVIWFFLTLVGPSVNNPIVRTLYILLDPFLAPVQRRLPRMRYDLSPLIVAGMFLLFNVVVVSTLIDYAIRLTARGLPLRAGAPIF